MIIYLVIVTVLFITIEVKNMFEILKIQQNYNYKYFDGNCNNRNTVCVIKCCDTGEVLDSKIADSMQVCMDSAFVGIDYKMEAYVYQSNDATGVPKKKNKDINKNITLVRNEKFLHRSTINKFTYEFYIFEDGSLKLKKNDEGTDQWIESSPLEFCIDYHESDVNNPLKLVANLAKKYNKDENDKLMLVAAGMVVSIVSLTLLIYRQTTRIVRVLGIALMTYTLCIMASYTSTAVQLCTMRIGIKSIGCRVISPFVYFSILSGLFLVNVFSYEALWKIRRFRKYGIKVDQLTAPTNLVRYCLFGFGIPSLMTIITVLVDILELLPIEISPFNSCFSNDTQTPLYMYLPVATLAVTYCVFFLMNIYNVWLLQRACIKVVDIKSVMIAKHRFTVYIKCVTLVFLSGAVEQIPNVPMVITATLHIFNVLVGGTLVFKLIYKDITCDLPSASYNVHETLKETQRNLSGRLPIKTTNDSNLLKCQASSENIQDSTMSIKIQMANELSVNNV